MPIIDGLEEHITKNKVQFIKWIFSLKDAFGSETPQTKAVIPSVLKQYKTEFKDAFINKDGSNLLQRSRQDPLISFDDLYDHGIMHF
jgi:hypothetical protein